jgi:hypothetical protein
MTTPEQPDLNPDRVRAILTHAINGLSPQDRAERIAYCNQHGHGASAHPDPQDDVLEFRWGGRPLAFVPFAVLRGDGPIVGQFVSELADDIGGLDDDA